MTQKGLGSGGGDGTRGAGKDGVLDVLVMENIFYGHATSRIYDLKARATDLQMILSVAPCIVRDSIIAPEPL